VTAPDASGAQMNGVVVEAVARPRLRPFVECQYQIYAGDPHWVPPLRRDEYHRLDPAHNPFWDHAESALWVARRGGEIVGRIAGIEDRLHNETHHDRLAMFGFFEARDGAVAQALLTAVETWARGRGSRAVRGPINPSMNDAAGLLVDGFDSEPYALMPYNPPSYARFIEDAGYRKAKDLFAWDIDLEHPRMERIAKLADRISRRHGIVVRPVNLKDFDRDLGILQTIYRAAWEDNWGFVAPTDAEMRQLAVDLKPILDPELLLFAELNGRPVGCSIGIPDVNQVLKKMKGRLLPFGLWHFLRRKQIVTRARILLMGVMPEYRRVGLYPLLIHECHRRGVAVGYRRAELSWTLEDNEAVNAGIEAAGGVHYKTYRLYEKPLG
jgi:GNAT superfamily N-acetyltransferase